MSDKAAERERVIFGFGLLIQPLRELCDRSTPPGESELRIAIAKMRGGVSEWRQTVDQLITFGPDLRLELERGEILTSVDAFFNGASQLVASHRQESAAESHERLRGAVAATERRFFEAVNRMPIDWKPSILPANTPFTAYRRIMQAIAPANRRLHYFDRYVKPSFFDLFLDPLRRGLEIRLITTGTGVKSVATVSELFAKEHSDYRLIEVDPGQLHDRNLRIDDRVFTLGPGTDRAGFALTNFGPADESPSAHAILDQLIASGRVVDNS